MRAAVRERESLRGLALDGDFWILEPTIGGAVAELTDLSRWVAWQVHSASPQCGPHLLRNMSSSDSHLRVSMPRFKWPLAVTRGLSLHAPAPWQLHVPTDVPTAASVGGWCFVG